MVVYLVVISCQDDWYSDYSVISIHATEQGAKDAVDAIWQGRVERMALDLRDREYEMADVRIISKSVQA